MVSLNRITRLVAINCIVLTSYQKHRRSVSPGYSPSMRCAQLVDTKPTIARIGTVSLTRVAKIWVKGQHTTDPLKEGTACVVNAEDGLLITNAHVCADMRDAYVRYIRKRSNGGYEQVNRRRVQVLYVEPHYDLALVRIMYMLGTDDELTDEFDFCDDDANSYFGQQVVCLGYPEIGSLLTTVGTIGCPASLYKQWFSDSTSTNDKAFLYHISGVAKGYSGGPLVNDRFQLVGVHHTTVELVHRFATTSSILLSFYERGTTRDYWSQQRVYTSDKKHRVKLKCNLKPLMGAEICWYNPALNDDYKMMATSEGQIYDTPQVGYGKDNGYILVWNVIKQVDSPTKNETLQQFDLITKINAKPVDSIHDLIDTLKTNSGKSVELTVHRNNSLKLITVTTEYSTSDSYNLI
ncbi:serine protease HTRA2, mitochondrial-like [Oppia nitens]|uniref:serine protease HTRA2, mitochondrial-like n=1 Tax=Oppia nitens TaxID=1686743 RepID=UPI0023DC0B20|nr:serine protease HTRA2, mitochondrial-like [Oppia nitens]